jgi:hypothetical protein
LLLQAVTSGAQPVTRVAGGGGHSLFLKGDGSLWAMGENYYGQLGDGTYNNTNRPEQILAAYNQISGQLLNSGDVRLSFVGIAGTNYALDRSFSLVPANWMPQVTNPAGSGGALVFTNTPNKATNNFWRIRSVPQQQIPPPGRGNPPRLFCCAKFFDRRQRLCFAWRRQQ